MAAFSLGGPAHGLLEGGSWGQEDQEPQHALLLNWKEEVRQWSSPGGEDPGVCGRLTPGGGSGHWQPREHPLVTGLGAVAGGRAGGNDTERAARELT